MTGEHEKDQGDRCYFCGGPLVMDLATIPFVVNGSVVVVKDVPAAVCTQCGEAIVTSEVAEILNRLLKQVEGVGFEVSVVPYSHLVGTSKVEQAA